MNSIQRMIKNVENENVIDYLDILTYLKEKIESGKKLTRDELWFWNKLLEWYETQSKMNAWLEKMKQEGKINIDDLDGDET